MSKVVKKPVYPNDIYNVEVERELLTEYNIEKTIAEITKVTLQSGSATLDLLLELASHHLQVNCLNCSFLQLISNCTRLLSPNCSELSLWLRC